jgi:hypothetical protein
MKKIKVVALYLWQLPQNLLGLLFLLFIRGEERHALGGINFYYVKGFACGISLGKYIILGDKCDKSVRHEYGHCIQSKKLGWLYLLVVGLPSLIHAAFHDCESVGKTYYHFWTEAWADKLMNIKR